jgi:hypothetical protein
MCDCEKSPAREGGMPGQQEASPRERGNATCSPMGMQPNPKEHLRNLIQAKLNEARALQGLHDSLPEVLPHQAADGLLRLLGRVFVR